MCSTTQTIFVYTEKSMSRKHPSEKSKVLYLEAKLVKLFFCVCLCKRKLVSSLGVAEAY